MKETELREKLERITKDAFIFNILYLALLVAVGTWFFYRGPGIAGVILLVVFMVLYFAGRSFLRGKYSDAVTRLREYLSFSRVLKDYDKPEKATDEASFLMMLSSLCPLWEKDVMIRELNTGTWRKRRVSIFDTSYLTAPEGMKQMAVGTAIAVEGKKSRNESYEWSEGEKITPGAGDTEGIDRILKEAADKNGYELHCAARDNRMIFFIRERVMGSNAYKPGKKPDERLLALPLVPELEDFLLAAEMWDRGQEETKEDKEDGSREK